MSFDTIPVSRATAAADQQAVNADLNSQHTPSSSSGKLDRNQLKELHQQYGSTLLRIFLNDIAIVSCFAAGMISWQMGMVWLTVPIWILGGLFIFVKPLAFHDAIHGTLHPNRTINELLGHYNGILIMVPLTVYRRAHAKHHGYMSTEADPELWPFVQTDKSWTFRFTAMVLETVFGMVYAPFLFARATCVDEKLSQSARNRILREYAVIALAWGVVFTAIHINGWWEQYLVGVLAPAVVAGWFQTLNKYTEHMGLHGDCVLTGTRSIIPKNMLNESISNMLQHIDHHGTHHIDGRIPFYNLPEGSDVIYEGQVKALPVYTNFLTAFWDMCKTLHDPKIGRQWLTEEAANQESAPATADQAA